MSQNKLPKYELNYSKEYKKDYKKLSYILASSYYRSLYSKVKNAKDIKDIINELSV